MVIPSRTAPSVVTGGVTKSEMVAPKSTITGKDGPEADVNGWFQEIRLEGKAKE